MKIYFELLRIDYLGAVKFDGNFKVTKGIFGNLLLRNCRIYRQSIILSLGQWQISQS